MGANRSHCITTCRMLWRFKHPTINFSFWSARGIILFHSSRQRWLKRDYLDNVVACNALCVAEQVRQKFSSRCILSACFNHLQRGQVGLTKNWAWITSLEHVTWDLKGQEEILLTEKAYSETQKMQDERGHCWRLPAVPKKKHSKCRSAHTKTESHRSEKDREG